MKSHGPACTMAAPRESDFLQPFSSSLGFHARTPYRTTNFRGNRASGLNQVARSMKSNRGRG